MESFKYLALGGGVQSSTIAELIVEGELEPVDIVLFADTGCEPEYVYSTVNYIKRRLKSVNIPLETVRAKTSIKDIFTGSRFASPPFFIQDDATGKKSQLRRQCTSEYKIKPLEKRVRELLADRGLARVTKKGIYIGSEYNYNKIRNLKQYRGMSDYEFNSTFKKLIDNGSYKQISIDVLLGITTDEATRMKPNRGLYFNNTWPLIDLGMSRSDCKKWLKSKNLPIPMKSACIVCPYHHDDYWKFIKDNRKLDWEYAVKYDEYLRSKTFRSISNLDGSLYMHRSCKPLADIDFTDTRIDDDFCDEGYCFI